MEIQKNILSLVFLFSTLFFLSSSSVAAAAANKKGTYNVQSFGAKSDGKSDCTKAFLSAWASACASTGPATIYVPPGRFLIGSALFGGQLCKSSSITIQIDGTLVAPSNFDVIGRSGNWIKFERVTGVSIIGGTLDGQGTSLWACKNSGKNCPKGATVSNIIHFVSILDRFLQSSNRILYFFICPVFLLLFSCSPIFFSAV